MRNLTAEEWVVVSGGHPSAEPSRGLQEVVVNGQRHQYRDPFSEVPYWMYASYWAHVPYGMRPAGYYEDQGGGGGGENSEDATPDVRDVGCIDLKPNVYDLKGLHQVAVSMAAYKAYTYDRFDEMVGIQPKEAAVLMYTLPGDSTVYPSEMAKGNEAEIPNSEWDKVLGKMPAGAVIVGVWHSHPASALPSGYLDNKNGGDWGFMSNLWQGKIGDWPVILKVDKNALMYITGKDGKTYVFDRSDYNRDGGVAPKGKTCFVNRVHG